MKQFLIRVFAFLAIGLTALAAAEYFVRSVPNDYSFKHSQMENHRDQIEILILGSSYGLFGLNPEYFDAPAFNFAFTSQSLDYDRFIFERYVDRLPKLRTVIIPVSPLSLNYMLEDGIEAWRRQRYVHYMGYWRALSFREKLQFENYSTLYQSDIKNQLRTAWRYRRKGESHVTVNKKGWSMSLEGTSPLGLSASGEQAAERHSSVTRREQPRRELAAIIEQAERRGLQVVLVTAPAWESYRNHIDEISIFTMHRHIDDLLAEYSNVRYLDLYEDPRFQRQHFYDGDHVNHQGARKLSLIVNDFVESHSSSLRLSEPSS